MFNDADETGLSDGDLTPGAQDKRSNVIPTLAEYKMPGLRGDIVASDGTVYATMKQPAEPGGEMAGGGRLDHRRRHRRVDARALREAKKAIGAT